ncbi:MAG TPA: hypothetical protein V6C52_02220 [Coleofasciculaceae cyanobacterium]|jgi:hypothetical protein
MIHTAVLHFGLRKQLQSRHLLMQGKEEDENALLAEHLLSVLQSEEEFQRLSEHIPDTQGEIRVARTGRSSFLLRVEHPTESNDKTGYSIQFELSERVKNSKSDWNAMALRLIDQVLFCLQRYQAALQNVAAQSSERRPQRPPQGKPALRLIDCEPD